MFSRWRTKLTSFMITLGHPNVKQLQKSDKNTEIRRAQRCTPLWPQGMFPNMCPGGSSSPVGAHGAAGPLSVTQHFIVWESTLVQNVRTTSASRWTDLPYVLETADGESVGLFGSQRTKTLHLPALQCSAMWAWLTRGGSGDASSHHPLSLLVGKWKSHLGGLSPV